MGRRRLALVLAAGVVIAGVLLVLMLGGDDRDRLERAEDELTDADGFDTALEAGETFAGVGGLLATETRACREEEGSAIRCQSLASASAYAQVLAAHVFACTAPGRTEARQSMLAYLREAAAPTPPASVPEPPLLPKCG